MAEFELSMYEEVLTKITDISKIANVTCNKEKKITFLNKQFSEIFILVSKTDGFFYYQCLPKGQ